MCSPPFQIGTHLTRIYQLELCIQLRTESSFSTYFCWWGSNGCLETKLAQEYLFSLNSRLGGNNPKSILHFALSVCLTAKDGLKGAWLPSENWRSCGLPDSATKHWSGASNNSEISDEKTGSALCWWWLIVTKFLQFGNVDVWPG